MSVDAIAAILWLVVIVYALTGGADFGGGVWDLLAGGSRRGARPRWLVARAIGPVWESNHVWLVIILVLLWTGFPQAFGAIMSTLFIPLSVAAFGIILRGTGFAFRQISHSLRYQRLTGAFFALSSVVTPFFFGAAAGAVITGKVPASGAEDRLTSWTTPTALTLGALSVVAFAYLAAVYLTREAQHLEPRLTAYFTRRALISGVLVGALAGLVLFEFETSAPRIAHRLTQGPGLPLLGVSIVLGTTVLIALIMGRTRLVRYAAAGAFAAMLLAWAVAQFPAMLPGSLSIYEAAAPRGSLDAEFVVVGAIAVLVLPSFLLLFRLSQRGLLVEEETTDQLLARLSDDHTDPR